MSRTATISLGQALKRHTQFELVDGVVVGERNGAQSGVVVVVEVHVVVEEAIGGAFAASVEGADGQPVVDDDELNLLVEWALLGTTSDLEAALGRPGECKCKCDGAGKFREEH
jgi:hypothetical protein